MTEPDLTGAPATPRPIHWAGTVALGIIWGTSFLSMALALDGFPPLWVATGRLVIGGLTLLAVERALAVAGMPGTGTPPPWPFVLGTGLFAAALPFALLTWGLQSVPSGFAGVSMAAVALFVLPLAHVFVPGERMTAPRTAGTAIGFVGVVLLIGPDALAGAGDAGMLPGRLACIASALCYAVASILTRRCPASDPIRFARAMTFAGAAMLLPVALLVDGPPPLDAGLLPVLSLLWVGILPTGLANLVRVLIVRSAGPGFMSLTAYQVPVWAVIFGALVLAEPITAPMLGALALIFSGIALTQLRPRGGRGISPPRPSVPPRP